MKLSGAGWQGLVRVGNALAWLIVVTVLHWMFPLPEDLVRMVQGGFIALVLNSITRPKVSEYFHPSDNADPLKTSKG